MSDTMKSHWDYEFGKDERLSFPTVLVLECAPAGILYPA
jgi:hypothetical protein